jgi:DNA-binding response OmpR family regulator
MPPHPRRILCVDDDPDTCSMLDTLFTLAGCEVTTADSVPEGRARAAAERFDLFILDGWLPGGSGCELCRSLRLSHPDTPVLFYSAASYDSDRQDALDAGAAAYLVKPSDIHLLVETARRLLGLSGGVAAAGEGGRADAG